MIYLMTKSKPILKKECKSFFASIIGITRKVFVLKFKILIEFIKVHVVGTSDYYMNRYTDKLSQALEILI